MWPMCMHYHLVSGQYAIEVIYQNDEQSCFDVCMCDCFFEKHFVTQVCGDPGAIPVDAPDQEIINDPMVIDIPLAGNLLPEEMDNMELDPAWDPDLQHPDTDPDLPASANHKEAGAEYKGLDFGEASLVLEALQRLAQEVIDHY